MWLISFLTGEKTLNQLFIAVHVENPHFLSPGGEYLRKIESNIDSKSL